MPRLVSRAELSRIARVSDAMVSKLCKGRLKPAVRDGRVDLDHEVVTAYLKQRGVTPPKVPAAPTTGQQRGARRSENPPALRRRADQAPEDEAQEALTHHLAPTMRQVLSEGPESVEDIDQYADMTLREIAQLFGSMSAHKDWLEMRKRQVEIQEKEIKNRELQGKLIPRELVRLHVFSAIEEAFVRLLSDAAKTITLRSYEMSKSGTPVESAETTVRELLGAVLFPVKDKAAKVLRRAARAAAEAREASQGAQPT